MNDPKTSENEPRWRVASSTLLPESFDGQHPSLSGRALKLLFVLLDHSDRVELKNELLDLVWPGVGVQTDAKKGPVGWSA